MKRFLLLQMVLVISASAQQWIEADNKDLITGKTTVSFGLRSQPPDNALLSVSCSSNGKYANIGLIPGFQVKRQEANPYSDLIHIRSRMDSKIKTFPGFLVGDRDNEVRLSLAPKGFLTSKEIVLQLTEFAEPIHQIVFKLDGPPPLPQKCLNQ
jgi:hypothetical protein